MKRVFCLVLLAGVAMVAGAFLGVCLQTSRDAAQLAEQRAAWEAEKVALEESLAAARARALSAATPAVGAAPVPKPSTSLSAVEILERLQTLRVKAGVPDPARIREAIYLLEELAHSGTSAVPVIREFLARYEDIDFDLAWGQSRTARTGKLPGDFIIPPSLRFGLFSVLRRIGGAAAENVLVDTLNSTGRGLEVAYLTRFLHEMAPNKYRDSALSAARSLLGSSLNATEPLDRYHRDYLFGVLSFYGDSTFASDAEAQLVRPDNQIDRGALQYLQQILGPQAVGIAAQAYHNPALQSNASAKEPLARLALHFAGADAQANEFYQQAINDPVLTKNHRSNLIEDLNEDGFPDPKNLTGNDLPLIQSRLALVEQLAPSAMDDVNAAAFKEAYKDLLNMRAKVTGDRPPAR